MRSRPDRYSATRLWRRCDGAALTNGQQYQIFNSEWSSKPHDALFCQFDLVPDRHVPKELEYLSREFIKSGKLDDLSGQSKFVLRLKAHLSQSLDELNNELWLTARNSKEAGFALGERPLFKGFYGADSGSLVADEHSARLRKRGLL